jgi:hypothetical protein
MRSKHMRKIFGVALVVLAGCDANGVIVDLSPYLTGRHCFVENVQVGMNEVEAIDAVYNGDGDSRSTHGVCDPSIRVTQTKSGTSRAWSFDNGYVTFDKSGHVDYSSY